MMSSHSQYLHPDYLQPLPTTLDAKKSPLALLAQTCSSIGKDTTPPKTLIPPLEKRDRDTVDKTSQQKRNERKPSASSPRRETSSSDSAKQSIRAPAPKEIPPLVPITSVHSEKSNKSLSVDSTSASKSPVAGNNYQHTPRSASSSSSTKETNSSKMSAESSQDNVAKTGLPPTAHPNPALAASTPKHSSGHSLFYPGALGYPSYAHLYAGLDAAAQSYHAALAAHAGLGLSHLHASAATASSLKPHGLSPLGATSPTTPPTSPYVSYARVKTAGGEQSVVPICRDPYCTTCQISMQNAQLSTCTVPGCTQCIQHKLLSTSSALNLPILPSLGGSLSSSAPSALPLPSSLYAHNMLSPSTHTPFICNWVAGSEYCGKRFPSSEELLQHLRTHTSSTDAYSSLLQSHSLAGSFGFPGAGVFPTPHYPTPSLSPNTLRRLYPSSLSPSSSSRYHPYGKSGPVTSLPSALPSLPAAPHPGLGALYSPYAALYGHKFGMALAP